MLGGFVIAVSHICGKIRDQVQQIFSFHGPSTEVFYRKSMTEIMDSGAPASVGDIRHQKIITKMIISNVLSHLEHFRTGKKIGVQTVVLVKLI